ncbi:hypothetical protein AB8A69_00615 [Bacillus tropicus]
MGEVMLKYIKGKIQNLLIRLFNSEKFKEILWELLMLIIDIVRGNDGKTKTDS